MKLQELGLKAKPQTKYFTHGYVSFETQNDELYYSVTFYKTKSIPSATTPTKPVKSLEHFNELMTLDATEAQA